MVAIKGLTGFFSVIERKIHESDGKKVCQVLWEVYMVLRYIRSNVQRDGTVRMYTHFSSIETKRMCYVYIKDIVWAFALFFFK